MRSLFGCQCPGTIPQRLAKWVVIQFRCNHSAFSGYHHTYSDYSEVKCTECGRRWRTKAKYVDGLPLAIDKTN